MSDRVAARLIGIFFILAAVSSIVGLVLYDPLLNGADLAEGARHAGQIKLGALMELVLVVMAIGTATTLFPYLRRYNETIALWHLCLRFMEAVIITVGIISMLAWLNVSESVAAGADAAGVQGTVTMLHGVHDWTFMLGPNFMLGLNTVMYSYILYRTRLVHRFIPILGMTGSALVFLAAILELFGVFEQLSVWGGLLSVTVAINEMSLAIWLLVKGFNRSAVADLAARTSGTMR